MCMPRVNVYAKSERCDNLFVKLELDATPSALNAQMLDYTKLVFDTLSEGSTALCIHSWSVFKDLLSEQSLLHI